MRNHSHRSRKRLAREAAWLRASPGRSPGGAKKSEMNPASSNMPSDWYSAKSCATVTNETKQTKQTRNESRGERFRKASTAAISPSQLTNIKAGSLLPNQKREG